MPDNPATTPESVYLTHVASVTFRTGHFFAVCVASSGGLMLDPISPHKLAACCRLPGVGWKAALLESPGSWRWNRSWESCSSEVCLSMRMYSVLRDNLVGVHGSSVLTAFLTVIFSGMSWLALIWQ